MDFDAWFRAYAAAFDDGRVEAVADCYHVPCLFVGPGYVAAVDSHEALTAALRARVDSHRDAGYARAAPGTPAVAARGDGLAAVTVPWTVELANGPPWRFTVTYDLVERDRRWRIVVAMTHAGAA